MTNHLSSANAFTIAEAMGWERADGLIGAAYVQQGLHKAYTNGHDGWHLTNEGAMQIGEKYELPLWYDRIAGPDGRKNWFCEFKKGVEYRRAVNPDIRMAVALALLEVLKDE